jgi:hypothetical protein
MTDLITLPRTTLQQALEALEYENSWHAHHKVKPYASTIDAITALNAALEQREQEQAEPSASWPTAIDIADELDALLPTSMGYSTRAAIETWWRDLVQRRLEQTEPCTYRCEAWPKCGCAALEQPNECHWLQDGDEDSDKWAASCGRHRYFQLNDGTPTDNRMTHCCYCGKPLVEVPIEPEDNHD